MRWLGWVMILASTEGLAVSLPACEMASVGTYDVVSTCGYTWSGQQNRIGLSTLGIDWKSGVYATANPGAIANIPSEGQGGAHGTGVDVDPGDCSSYNYDGNSTWGAHHYGCFKSIQANGVVYIKVQYDPTTGALLGASSYASQPSWGVTPNASPSAGGVVFCDSPVDYNSSTPTHCTVSANAGYDFSSWAGDCAGTPIDSDCTFINVTSMKTATAIFTQETRSFATATSGNGSGSLNGSTPGGSYSHGTNITLAAAANPGSTFAGWSPASCLDGFSLTADTTCTATFTLDTHTFATATHGNGSGTVNGSTPGGSYDYGTSITLAAAANPGSTFTGWSPSSCLDGFSLTADTTCTATFTLDDYSVTASAAGGAGGNPACTPSSVHYGDSSTCSANTAPGYSFVNWSGDCAGQPESCALNNIQANKVSTANFAILTSSQQAIPTRASGVAADLTIAGCDAIDAASFVDAPEEAPYTFPFGLLDFSASSCASSVTVTMVFSQDVPEGTQFYKCQNDSCSPYPATIVGNTVTYSVTDGGTGDADGVVNNAIADPAGLGFPSGLATIPTLDRWALMILAGMLAMMTSVMRYRRSS